MKTIHWLIIILMLALSVICTYSIHVYPRSKYDVIGARISIDSLVLRSEIPIISTGWTRVTEQPFPIYADVQGNHHFNLKFERERIYLNGALYGLVIRNWEDVERNIVFAASIQYLCFYGRLTDTRINERLKVFSAVRAVFMFSPVRREIGILAQLFPSLFALDVCVEYFHLPNLDDLALLKNLQVLSLWGRSAPRSLSAIGKIVSLRSLSFSTGGNEVYDFLVNLPNLEAVEVRNQTPILLDAAKFLEKAPDKRLRSVSLRGTFNFESYPEKLDDFKLQAFVCDGIGFSDSGIRERFADFLSQIARRHGGNAIIMTDDDFGISSGYPRTICGRQRMAFKERSATELETARRRLLLSRMTSSDGVYEMDEVIKADGVYFPGCITNSKNPNWINFEELPEKEQIIGVLQKYRIRKVVFGYRMELPEDLSAHLPIFEGVEEVALEYSYQGRSKGTCETAADYERILNFFPNLRSLRLCAMPMELSFLKKRKLDMIDLHLSRGFEDYSEADFSMLSDISFAEVSMSTFKDLHVTNLPRNVSLFVHCNDLDERLFRELTEGVQIGVLILNIDSSFLITNDDKKGNRSITARFLDFHDYSRDKWEEKEESKFIESLLKESPDIRYLSYDSADGLTEMGKNGNLKNLLQVIMSFRWENDEILKVLDVLPESSLIEIYDYFSPSDNTELLKVLSETTRENSIEVLTEGERPGIEQIDDDGNRIYVEMKSWQTQKRVRTKGTGNIMFRLNKHMDDFPLLYVWRSDWSTGLYPHHYCTDRYDYFVANYIDYPPDWVFGPDE